MFEDIRQHFDDWLKTIFIAIILSLFLRSFIFSISYVDGQSMTPTLDSGDRLLLQRYKIHLGMEDFHRGDIVVFRAPSKKKKDYIKRIIGLEGDKINIVDGQVYVNDRALSEYYIEDGVKTDPVYFGNGYIVPKGKVFVVGDNRNPSGSYDSRYFGAISTKAIKGKTKYMIHPNFKKIQ